MIQQIEAFFAGLTEMSTGLPLFVMVPIIIILAIAGTVVFIKAIQGLIKLIFRNKGKEFIDGCNNFTMNVDERTKDLAKDLTFGK